MKTEHARFEQRPKVRVGAVGDLHCAKDAQGHLRPLFEAAAAISDILLLAGDLTDHGHPEEARVLAREMSGIHIPIVAVLGNHDFEIGKAEEVAQILTDAGAKMLDGDACEILGIGIAGVKGFGGGFGRWTLSAWGEEAIKRFVAEAVNESLRLEAALVRLQTPQRIALLHYSPIEGTVEGEPRELFPFLGCSRLAEPLMRYPVSVVFHGHAHHGSAQGALGETPVYNVSLPLMRHIQPDQPPIRVIELPKPTE